MREYKVDVPVRVMIWTRPELLKKQFEILREAAPSTLFLVSDGGRNQSEKDKILESRRIFDDIDWNCKVYKIYYEDNQGLYTIFKVWNEFIWSKVDRCVFLEDDYLPSVCFFEYCAELLEKYKDDERIEMITGNNVLGVYDDAHPYDYFFTEVGWSIWGTATWKRVAKDYGYPFDYAENEYIKKCARDNLTDFWYKKFDGYCNKILVDNHVPGTEYFHAINSVLYHRLSIVPCRNMIKNMGVIGEHANYSKGEDVPEYFNSKTYELEFPLKHPQYVIDDKAFGIKYQKLLGHHYNRYVWFMKRVLNFFDLLFKGKLLEAIKNKINPKIER